MKHRKKQESGFALLITLLVIGVATAIGLSILELSQQQVRLADNSADSEYAFQAANASLECARFHRHRWSNRFEGGDDTFSVSCLGDNSPFTKLSSINLPVDNGGGSGVAYRYVAEFDWNMLQSGGAFTDRCSQIDMLVMVNPSNSAADLVVGNAGTPVTDEYPGYPDGDTKTCQIGGRCTLIAVKGYSKACSNITSLGTIQREVLLQF